MPVSDKPQSRYMPGLDGLRALALIGVMGYHWNFGFAGGGFLGVSLFFVLSGYLITDILAAQWQHERRIDLKDFWIRRFRRLLPAMLVMLLLVVVWVTLFDRSRLVSLRGEVLGAITYISNWQFIYEQKSYFEAFGPPSPLGHFWSLAVEEQFYLLWPLIMMIGLKLFPRRGSLFIVIMLGALASALAMGLLYQPGGDPSRVYYGTDTRAFGLLIGAALAIVWPSRKLSVNVSPAAKRGLSIAGITALAIILFMMWQTDRYDPFLYQGGMLLFSIVAAVLVAVLAHPAAPINRLLSWKPLLWLGVRSYGIYLWHYPVMILTASSSPTAQTGWLLVVWQIGLSLLLASLSWTFVEEPIRHGGLNKLRAKLHRGRHQPATISIRGWLISLSSLMMIGIFCTGMMSSVSDAKTVGSLAAILNIDEPVTLEDLGENSVVSEVKPPDLNEHDHATSPSEANRNGDAAANVTVDVPPINAKDPAVDKPNPDDESIPTNDTGIETVEGNPSPSQETSADNTSSHPIEDTEPIASEVEKDDLPPVDGASSELHKPESDRPAQTEHPPSSDSKHPPAADTHSGSNITAIGDSVMLGVTPFLETALPGIHIDAVIGRQMRQAAELMPALKQQNRIDGGVVIIALGTNGTFLSKDLDSLLNTLEGADQILLVNSRVPRDWEQSVNELLAKAASAHPKVTLVDWYSASKGHPEFFRADRVHLEPEGAKAYTSLLIQAMKK
ncbi:hypothetical protein JCM10914A_06840 [Paenibacillus sp. JCM 10914]|uniref:acyltransferase family protein n=1 Tax=Paenibacillus sp. JCM 10914 TaxID=1236974 RepID=UPI0003CC5F98|nr:acyltransferase family protein [Paenibacillus sp. JCM 10914]GAE05811.1 hypothetical protein JCM10914_1935 [Paenibacillus sp. JCM 10914]